MIIYPVLDLKEGLVVRGHGGDRANYLPVRSRLVESAEPLSVARAFREKLGLATLYIADLDAIGGATPCIPTLLALEREGFRLLVDAGVRGPGDAELIARAGVSGVIAALETLPGPEALREIVRAMGPERAIFSLDLKESRLLGDATGWPFDDAHAVAREAIACGVTRILLLDLAQVGSGRGPGHLGLLARLANDFSGIEILSGGGVRSALDLEAFAAAGAHGVLVASALHDGAITRSEIEQFHG